MKKIYKLSKLKVTVWLSLAAALFYSSWPLGFLLNPSVGHHDLASQLEAPHQPYSWLFIALDVLTGLSLVIIGMMQLQKCRNTMMTVIIFSYMLFGALVATAALLPLSCDPTLGQCGPLIRAPRVIVHGASSIISVNMLLVSVLLLAKTVYEGRSRKIVQGVFGLILGGWLVFGVGSLLEMAHHIHSNFLQYYFITVCSLSIILVVGVVNHFEEEVSPQSVPQQD